MTPRVTIDPADIRLWRRRLPRHAEAALAAGRATGAASRRAGKGRVVTPGPLLVVNAYPELTVPQADEGKER
jgi:hypothetical protein